MILSRLVVTLLVSVLSFFLITPTTAQGAPDKDTAVNTAAIQRLGACLTGGGQGQVIILMDRSGSLRNTDSDAARVTAAKFVVEQFAQVSATYGWKIDIAIAGFDTVFEKTFGWVALNAGSLSQISGAIKAFATETSGLDTDYWNALDGARKALAERSGGEGAVCPFLVMLTDGEFDVDPRPRGEEQFRAEGGEKPYAPGNKLETEKDAEQAMKAGVKDLCRAGGVADQLRSTGIITLVVGLKGNQEKQPDWTLIQGVATSQGKECGELTDPAPGAFFPADGLDGLLQAFDQIAAGGNTTIQEVPNCVGEICPEGTHRFVLDGSIGGLHALATSSDSTQHLVLVAPNDHQIELMPGVDGERKLRGTQLNWEWLSDRSISVDLSRLSDDGWVGEWRLAFVGDQKRGTTRSSLHLYGDILPSWPGATSVPLRAGQSPNPLVFGLARVNGDPIDPNGVTSDLVFGARLVGIGGEVAVADGLTATNVDTPQTVSLEGLNPGPATMKLTLEVTTSSWRKADGTEVPGTKLEPMSKDIPVTILPPANFPTVTRLVDFGTTEEAGAVTRELLVEGLGCAWLEKVEFTSIPEGVTTDALKLTSSVKDSATCAAGSLPLILESTALGNGLVSGKGTVQTLPIDDQGKPLANVDPVPATFEFRQEMTRPASVPIRLATLIAVTLLGVAIPIGLLYAMKYATAKLGGDGIRYVTLRGRVGDRDNFLERGIPTALHELRTVALDGTGRRRVDLGDGLVFTTRVGLSPTEVGYAVLNQPGLAAAGGTRPVSHRGKAKFPLAMQGSWCVALDPVDPRGGEVSVSLFTGLSGQGWDDVSTDARQNVRAFVEELRASVPTQTPSGLAPSFGNDRWDVSTSPGKGAPSSETPPPPSNDGW